MSTIKVKMVHSGISCPKIHRRVLVGLGLKKLYSVRELPDTPATWGMVKKIPHLVKVVTDEEATVGKVAKSTLKKCTTAKPEMVVEKPVAKKAAAKKAVGARKTTTKKTATKTAAKSTAKTAAKASESTTKE